jgi:hypothetical protein
VAQWLAFLSLKWLMTGVMVNVLVSKAVDRGFIGGVMVSILVSKVV